MKWFQFILGALATYRLARMVSMESGPGFIFRKLRGFPNAKKHPSVKEGLSCLCCSSVWIGSGVSAFYLWLEWITWQESILYPFALSAVAVLLNLFSKQE